MSLNWIFHGYHSYEDLHILTHKVPPFHLPEKNVKKIEIPGRDGALYEDEGTYKTISISVECAINCESEEEMLKRIGYIKKVLSLGEGELIFESEPNLYYRARVINQIDITNSINNFGTFIILFECQPFRYYRNEAITLTTPGKILNYGAVPSKPLIKVYGTGDITLSVGNENVTLKGLTDEAIMNPDIFECYKEVGGIPQSLNDKMYGDYLTFQPGENDVKWVGNVQKVEILPNWRCL